MSNFTDSIYTNISIYFNIWKQKYYMKNYCRILHKMFGLLLCVNTCIYVFANLSLLKSFGILFMRSKGIKEESSSHHGEDHNLIMGKIPTQLTYLFNAFITL